MKKLFYRYNKNKFTNVQIQEQTDSEISVLKKIVLVH